MSGAAPAIELERDVLLSAARMALDIAALYGITRQRAWQIVTKAAKP